MKWQDRLVLVTGAGGSIGSHLVGEPVDRSDVRRLRADITKASKLLGWSPRISLHEGLARTIEWISHNLHPYQPSKYQI